MEKEALDLSEVTNKFSILGVPLNATKEECRRARNTLLHHFHPDKHPYGWNYDDVLPEKRVFLIQNAYLFIIENYDEIAQTFRFLSETSLTNRMPVKTRSHWAYTTVASYEKDNDSHKE